MNAIADLWQHLQRKLLPDLAEEHGELGPLDRRFVRVIALLPLGGFVSRYAWPGVGRPPKERIWLLHAFIAKTVYKFPTNKALIEALRSRATLRGLCGWETAGQVPTESTFSRAFARFAADELPQQVHAALISVHCAPKLVGHVSRDATAIEVAERVRKPKKPSSDPAPAVRYRPGRPKQGERRPPKPPTKIQLQLTRGLAENLADLPRHCDVGCKRNSKGHTDWLVGYKLHLDVIDGDIPVSAILTSASTNDCHVAIPLAQMTDQRVRALYELMDAAYDAEGIWQRARGAGHVPIIERNPRGGAALPMDPAQARRYQQRTASERVNGRLKEEFGGRTVRVKGAVKVMCHLMFGVLVIAALGIWQRLT